MREKSYCLIVCHFCCCLQKDSGKKDGSMFSHTPKLYIGNAGGKGVAKLYKEGVRIEEFIEHLKNAKCWKKTRVSCGNIDEVRSRREGELRSSTLSYYLFVQRGKRFCRMERNSITSYVSLSPPPPPLAGPFDGAWDPHCSPSGPSPRSSGPFCRPSCRPLNPLDRPSHPLAYPQTPPASPQLLRGMDRPMDGRTDGQTDGWTEL